MLIDDVVITIKAGNGGNGSLSFRRNAQTDKGGPDGGNGGNGGSVYLQGSTDIADLAQFRYKKNIRGQNGIAGKQKNLFGKNGEDTIVLVPVGTRVIDTSTGVILEIGKKSEFFLIAHGGKGGKGNNEFKSALNQTPLEFEKGEKGEEKKVRLELRLIADVGFVGYPNAGKSSLLLALTNATPKIGDYPFTTLEPNLGIAQGIILADIPGIIEGASKGKGLGFRFLRHIEKTKILVYCIDSTEENLWKIYTTLQSEFKAYNASLLEKPELILFTKIDLITPKILVEKQAVFLKEGKKVLGLSIHNEKTLSEFKKQLVTLVAQ